MCASGRRCRAFVAVVALAMLTACRASDARSPLEQAAITEHRGAALPLDITLTDADGRPLPLRSLVRPGTPLLIDLAYFSCPMLCPLGRAGLGEALRASGLRPGIDVQVLTVSIDPRDTVAGAAEWQRQANDLIGASGHASAWHVAVGRPAEVRRLSDALGFLYAYDPGSAQFAHTMALFVIDGRGRIAQYLYGFSVDPGALTAAVEAARHNRPGTAVERFILRCFHYIPSLRRHGSTVTWILRLGGAGVVLAVGWLLAWLARAGSRRAV